MRKPQRKPGRTGRPRLAEVIDRVTVTMPRAMIEVIDAMREARLDRPDRAAMVRELIAEAVAARRQTRE